MESRPCLRAGMGTFLTLDYFTILLYFQYVNLYWCLNTLERFKVIIAIGLTSSHPEQRS